jgi:hypothetical protein
MEPEWLSYQEVAARLGVSPEAARSRAKRLGWRRQLSNDGRAKVLVALEPRQPGDGPVAPRSPPERKAADAHLINALEAHVATLKEQLAAAEGKAAEHIASLKAQLSGAEAREAAALAELTAERSRTDAAIAAFASLADRLDALAAERSRPWWRRLVG